MSTPVPEPVVPVPVPVPDPTQPPVVNEFAASLIRTVVPMIVVCLGWLLTKVHMSVNNNLLAAGAALALGTVYYAVVRLLETKFSKQWGWLLGLAKIPTYLG